MENKSSRKYSIVAKLVGILSGFILVLGTSYAVFRVTTTGEKENVVSAGKLDVRIENEQNEISLGNTLPQTEEEGKQNTPYTFDIVNKGTINAMYDLYIEVNNDSTLDANLVRYYLTVVENGEEKQITPTGSIISSEEENTKEGKKAYKIDTKYLDVDKTNNYKLYLWIDYDATKEEASNKTFKANIRVDAEQIYKENKLVKQVDVSENNDGSVIAYMYGKDTMVIKGKGKIKSGLSDSLKFANEEVLPNYKKVLKSMGVDVSNINTLDDLQNYIDSQESEFNDQLNNQIAYICAKGILQEMNKDSSEVTDMESLVAYLQKLGWMDEEGTQTEAGEEFFTKFEDSYNKNYSIEGYNPSKIVIEDGITSIPRYFFFGNEEITEIKIPNSVIEIGEYAFENCGRLKNITLPENLTKLENGIFRYCVKLQEITIPAKVTSVGNNAFYNCKSLEKINVSLDNESFSSFDGVLYNKDKTDIVIVPMAKKTITLSDNLTRIDEFDLSDCNKLISIFLSKGITYIDSPSFNDCVSLENIMVSSENKKYSSEEGVLYNKDKTTLVRVPIAKADYKIPSSVINLYPNSFANNLNLVALDMTDSSVTSIGSNAFQNCKNLESILLSENLTNIGPYAFQYCNRLSSIIIPSKVTAIQNSTFYGCTSLKNITIPSTITKIGVAAFQDCTSLTSLEIPATVTSIGDSAFYGCKGIKTITIPEAVQYMGKQVFSGWSSLQTINVDKYEKMVIANWTDWDKGCNANINYLRT